MRIIPKETFSEEMRELFDAWETRVQKASKIGLVDLKTLMDLWEKFLRPNTFNQIKNINTFWFREALLPNAGTGFVHVNDKPFNLLIKCNGNVEALASTVMDDVNAKRHLVHTNTKIAEGAKYPFRHRGLASVALFPRYGEAEKRHYIEKSAREQIRRQVVLQKVDPNINLQTEIQKAVVRLNGPIGPNLLEFKKKDTI